MIALRSNTKRILGDVLTREATVFPLMIRLPSALRSHPFRHSPTEPRSHARLVPAGPPSHSHFPSASHLFSSSAALACTFHALPSPLPCSAFSPLRASSSSSLPFPFSPTKFGWPSDCFPPNILPGEDRAECSHICKSTPTKMFRFTVRKGSGRVRGRGRGRQSSSDGRTALPSTPVR